jgi:hypothetical protein
VTGPNADDLQLLRVDLATSFVLNDAGRIVWENEPTPSPAPRLCWLGCPTGHVAAVHADVGDAVAARLRAIIAEAPTWSDPDALPPCLPLLLALLGTERVGRGVIYALPGGLAHDASVRIVRSETAQGEALMTALARQMPPALVEAGFATADDFWAPWCVALEGDQIAATAFAARLGPRGAEIGVYTFPGFRGRGLAAAVTAAWSSHPALIGRALFYSRSADNASSGRVAQRLGLRRIGASLRVT